MIVFTVFDSSLPPKPLITFINDSEHNNVYKLYAKGTGKILYEVNKSITEIAGIIEASKTPVLLNNPKAHLYAFGLTKSDHLNQLNINIPRNINHRQLALLFKTIVDAKPQPLKWRSLLGRSSAAYKVMETRELYLDEQRVYPQYELDTFTGRSRCLNYNIQGATNGAPIHTNNKDDILICLDWIAADIRVAAAFSKDEYLNESFKNSDPHTMLSEALDMPRDQCKRLYLKTIYSLDMESPILGVFPELKEWMIKQTQRLEEEGYLGTLLDRRFKIGDRDKKSVFNAVLQGTVAHAMQSSLVNMTHELRKHLITETHDSIVFACRSGLVPHVIKAATEIMIRPLDEFPRFPLRVYIGKVWKEWKLYREFR